MLQSKIKNVLIIEGKMEGVNFDKRVDLTALYAMLKKEGFEVYTTINKKEEKTFNIKSKNTGKQSD